MGSDGQGKRASTPEGSDRPSRPTVVPAFDVQTYARAVDEGPPRAMAPTMTNEDALEAARQASARASFAPPQPQDGDRAGEDPILEVDTVEVDLTGYDSEAESEEAIAARCRVRLGPLDRIPVLTAPVRELVLRALQSQAMHILHFVDGARSLTGIVDVSGMPAIDALVGLLELLDKRFLVVSDRRLPSGRFRG